MALGLMIKERTQKEHRKNLENGQNEAICFVYDKFRADIE